MAKPLKSREGADAQRTFLPAPALPAERRAQSSDPVFIFKMHLAGYTPRFCLVLDGEPVSALPNETKAKLEGRGKEWRTAQSSSHLAQMTLRPKARSVPRQLTGAGPAAPARGGPGWPGGTGVAGDDQGGPGARRHPERGGKGPRLPLARLSKPAAPREPDPSQFRALLSLSKRSANYITYFLKLQLPFKNGLYLFFN